MIITKYSVVLAGCFMLGLFAACIHRGEPSAKLYYEPPSRLIEDYTGMVEAEEVNWAWAQPGFRLSSYEQVTIKPVSNLTSIDNLTIPARLYEGLAAWYELAGFSLSDDGQISCECAIVELYIEKSFLQKINPFREDEKDFFLEAEFIVKEMPTQNTLCKIRHGVTAFQSDQLASLFLSGIARYFDARR